MTAREEFLDAVRGVPGHHVIAAMNLATPGVEWRNCSKSRMADDYAKVKTGGRFSLGTQANIGRQYLNLPSLRRAAIERLHGNPEWRDYYTRTPS